MQLYPTRATFHVAVVGAGLVALGCAARLAPVVGYGGAMLLAVAIGRAFALLSVTRLRAAGLRLDAMATGPATRVYNVLVGENRRVSALLLGRWQSAAACAACRAVGIGWPGGQGRAACERRGGQVRGAVGSAPAAVVGAVGGLVQGIRRERALRSS